MLIVVPSADVNWLLSTEVQSGAALVAIVGGLLVARLAGLSGERTYLRRAIRDAGAELALARENDEKAQDELAELHAYGFRRFASMQLLKQSGVVNRKDLVRLLRESNWAPGDHGMAEVVHPWITQMRLAFEKASEYIAGHPDCTPGEVREAMMEGVARISADLLDDVVDELNSRGDLGPEAHRVYMYTAGGKRAGRAEAAAAERQTRDRRLDEARARADQYQAVIRAAQAKLANLEAARAQTARPEGLGRIIAALGYLTGACVVVPLAVMSWGRTSLPAWSRALIVALFISGLAIFLLVIVDLLRDQPERDRPSGGTVG
jgi:hypothetical protein